jgi:aryl-alcohol dehydrogenase-like predicted oxidoreductase
LNGLWQVSGGHGSINQQSAVDWMFNYHERGFTTWDLADHYGPAEDLIGTFKNAMLTRQGSDSLKEMQAFTKWVPRPGKMTRQIVENNINISLKRMKADSLDMLQFHWWEYNDLNYLEALKHLADLQNEGKIRLLSLTNFDTRHLEIILNNGIKIATNQVQFSLIDTRPLLKMVAFCQNHNIKLLTYGTVCGGLISEKYLGKPEPTGSVLNTVSLRKYKNMIDMWGGWRLFQQLLVVLGRIAEKHHSSIPWVAIRYILDQPTVAGVIIGARLSISEHIEDNARVFDLNLDPEDLVHITEITRRGKDLMHLIGDCGDEYRR